MLMIRRNALGAGATIALFVIGACDGGGSAIPTAPPASSAVSRGEAPSFSKSSRSGVLQATKACPDYHGSAGDFCSITSSNLADVEVGSRIYYASPLVDGKLDSDLIL